MERKSTETKAPAVTVETCPEREHHRKRLNQVCAGCAELIPGHGQYTPAEMARYFTMPQAEAPRSPFAPDEENARLWREYDQLRLEREDAIFALEAARRGRQEIRRTSVVTDAAGNIVSDDSATSRGLRADLSIAEHEAQVSKIEERVREHLETIRKADAARGARALQAMYAESFPQASSGVLERVVGALRGGA